MFFFFSIKKIYYVANADVVEGISVGMLVWSTRLLLKCHWPNAIHTLWYVQVMCVIRRSVAGAVRKLWAKVSEQRWAQSPFQ